MEKTKKPFTKEDHKAVDLFVELGMPRNLAKTLIFISKVDEARSDDIEKATNLRQPEVSIAVRELARRGWTTTREQKKQGKGRPVHIYKLTNNLSEIVKDFEQEKHQQIQDIQQNLNDLEALLIE